MRYYESLLDDVTHFDIDKEIRSDKCDASVLDALYYRLFCQQEELKLVRPLLVAVGAIPDDQFAQAAEHAQLQFSRILSCYEDLFTKCSFMGASEAFEDPHIIVVLGCSKPLINSRLRAAVDYASSFPNAAIVLSGGGFSPHETEASLMYRQVLQAGVQNQILLEEDSMDTVGNALFTKLLLKDKGLLREGLRLAVVTSNFHMPRSLYCFQGIFNRYGSQNRPGQQVRIAVRGVGTEDRNLLADAAHEIMSQYMAIHALGIFDLPEGQVLDDQDILLKLFQRHDLYKNRYDILRHHLSLASG